MTVLIYFLYYNLAQFTYFMLLIQLYYEKFKLFNDFHLHTTA